MADAPDSKRPDGLPVGKPFEKGDTRINRKGRPKLKVRLRELDDLGVTALKEDLMGPAGPERTAAQKLFFAYRWGKPTETVKHQGADGGALVVEIHEMGAE